MAFYLNWQKCLLATATFIVLINNIINAENTTTPSATSPSQKTSKTTPTTTTATPSLCPVKVNHSDTWKRGYTFGVNAANNNPKKLDRVESWCITFPQFNIATAIPMLMFQNISVGNLYAYSTYLCSKSTNFLEIYGEDPTQGEVFVARFCEIWSPQYFVYLPFPAFRVVFSNVHPPMELWNRFRASVSSVAPKPERCNQFITGDTGTITNVNYNATAPKHHPWYPCFWAVQVNTFVQGTNVVQLSFTAFEVGTVETCTSVRFPAYVEVFSGWDRNISLGRFCGRQTALTFNINGPKFRVEFRSNPLYSTNEIAEQWWTGPGFSATWSVIASASFDPCSNNPCLNNATCTSTGGVISCACTNGCEGPFCDFCYTVSTNTTGVINPMVDSRTYPAFFMKEYAILPTFNMTTAVNLKFDLFTLQVLQKGPAMCSRDALIIYMNNEQTYLMGVKIGKFRTERYCGNFTGRNFTLNTNDIRLLFVGDPSDRIGNVSLSYSVVPAKNPVYKMELVLPKQLAIGTTTITCYVYFNYWVWPHTMSDMAFSLWVDEKYVLNIISQTFAEVDDTNPDIDKKLITWTTSLTMAENGRNLTAWAGFRKSGQKDIRSTKAKIAMGSCDQALVTSNFKNLTGLKSGATATFSVNISNCSLPVKVKFYLDSNQISNKQNNNNGTIFTSGQFRLKSNGTVKLTYNVTFNNKTLMYEEANLGPDPGKLTSNKGILLESSFQICLLNYILAVILLFQILNYQF